MASGLGRALNRLALSGVAIGLGSWAFDECLYTVEGGHRAVIWNRLDGVQKKVAGEGTHFRIPLLEYPTIFDVRLQPRVISSKTGTKDLQTVTVSIRVLSRPEVDGLPEIFRTLGRDFDERVLPSIVNEVVKATVAQFDAEQLLTQRDKVSRQIKEAIEERAMEFNLVLDDVAITHLAYGRDFTQAIEAKQVAQQDAERSKFVVLKAEQERKAAVIRAEGESQAAELISEALKNNGTGMIEVKRIDAAREIADTLARSRNVTYLPSTGASMLLSVGKGGR